jgi:hypothetical protein
MINISYPIYFYWPLVEKTICVYYRCIVFFRVTSHTIIIFPIYERSSKTWLPSLATSAQFFQATGLCINSLPLPLNSSSRFLRLVAFSVLDRTSAVNTNIASSHVQKILEILRPASVTLHLPTDALAVLRLSSMHAACFPRLGASLLIADPPPSPLPLASSSLDDRVLVARRKPAPRPDLHQLPPLRLLSPPRHPGRRTAAMVHTSALPSSRTPPSPSPPRRLER